MVYLISLLLVSTLYHCGWVTQNITYGAKAAEVK